MAHDLLLSMQASGILMMPYPLAGWCLLHRVQEKCTSLWTQWLDSWRQTGAYKLFHTCIDCPQLFSQPAWH